MTESQTGIQADVLDHEPTMAADAGHPPKPSQRAWLVAVAIGAAVSIAAQIFLVFVGAGLTVPVVVGILAGTFIAGRRLRVHGLGPWLFVGLAVLALQYVVSFVIGLVLGYL